MFRHWKQMLKVIFPESGALIRHAEASFMRFWDSDAGQRLEWTPEKVASHVLEYLAQAKSDLNYDDSPKALFRHWLKWRKNEQVKYRSRGKYDGRLIPESIPGLPKRFKPTTTRALYRGQELYQSNEKLPKKRRYKKRKLCRNSH
jgi:hypothetical protein